MNKKIFYTLLAVTVLGHTSCRAEAENNCPLNAIYISCTGSDDNSGSEDAPLATLIAAKNRIREMKKAGNLPVGGMTVYLRGGDYELDYLDTDNLTPGNSTCLKLEYNEDSVPADSPVIYRSYPGEKVTLALSPKMDFRVNIIINQAENVFFKDIEVTGGRWHALTRPVIKEINPVSGTPIRITDNGRANAVVVIADDASGIAAYAAGEFVYHVKRASGAELTIVRESELDSVDADFARVYIGNTAAAKEIGLDVDELPPEVYYLKTSGNNIFILGRETEGAAVNINNPYNGTLHALYDLLGRDLGVRWLWPGELGTHVPEIANVIIEPVDEVREPALRYRHWYDFDSDPATAAYLQRHGASIGVRPLVHHHFEHWWGRFGQEHPEWFALSDSAVRRGPALCVSNQEMRQYAVNRRSRPADAAAVGGRLGTDWDDHWNGGPVYTCSESDAGVWCFCTSCRALDGENPPPVNTKYLWFWHMITERYTNLWQYIRSHGIEINPDIVVTAFIYWQTYHAPAGELDLRDRYFGEFVPWQSQDMWMPMPEECMNFTREQYLGWVKTGIHMGYRPNFAHGGYVMPFFSTRQLGEFLQFMYSHGNLGWNYDRMFDNWATQGPMLYLLARLNWDPELSIEQVRDEYFSGFGPAAFAMEQYFDFWENHSHFIVENSGWPQFGGGQLYDIPKLYTQDIFEQAEGLLDAATAAAEAGDSVYLQRVGFIRQGFVHARAVAEFISLLDNGHVVTYDSDIFEATCKAWEKIKSLREICKNNEVHFYELGYSASLESSIKGIELLGKDFDEISATLASPWAPWLLRADPEDIGEKQDWYAADTDENMWQAADIPATLAENGWNGQNGYVWLRTKFRFPAEWEGCALELKFGDIKGEADIFINGVFVDSNKADGAFDVYVAPDIIKPGAENVLVIKLFAADGACGIIRNVRGKSPHPENRRNLPTWE